MRWLRALAVLFPLMAVSLPVGAQGAIRDDETERYLRRLADPLLEAAGLRPEDLRIFILADPRLNAFVAGGQNLFVFTGLIEATETPEQLAGVIAHEIGHIAGGHLTRMARAGEQAGQQALIGALLGIAAVVAGAPQLGTAAVVGSQAFARQQMLTFTRTQEQAADQAAVTYLRATGMPVRGLLEVMRILDTRGRGITGGGGEFLQTHPLTRDRIRFLESQVAAGSASDGSDPALEALHRRVVAKLVGFLAPPQDALRRYRGKDFAARYARAIALYRDLRFDESMRLLDELLAERPEDPYLFELKGQFLFERGQVAEAEPLYREALRFLPDSALIRVAFARTLIEQDRS
ncbi:MAG TPA: tetratricopeptide repeat protein, partial [Rhodospirillales bacterium]|nr:tetratricopeptide repeat protein [Rhodospirillales bacterium]